jgi:hypothetical protein
MHAHCARAGGGPRSLRLLLEGESLLNDASSITLFTIFLSEVQDARAGIHQSGGQVLGSILSRTVWLAVGARPRPVQAPGPCMPHQVSVALIRFLHASSSCLTCIQCYS